MSKLINGRTSEEIITGLKCEVPCHKCAYRDHNFMKDDSCSYYVEQDIIALIEHLEAQQPKWIKLTEDNRPPDGYYNVMVKKRGVWQRDLLRYDACDDDWWKELSTHDELVPGYLITHWMPLPEPPKGEEE